MAYIESSLMMFRGESHKLLSAAIPDESGIVSSRTYGMVYKNGEIIWEILGRKGKQIVMPIYRYKNVSDPWHNFTVVMDIEKGGYILQDSVGQDRISGFIVNDMGIMVRSLRYSWHNISTNGAVFYNPESGRKLSGDVSPYFGKENCFYGVGTNELIKLTVDDHGMVEDEEVVEEIEGLSSALYLKYKGCDFCILYINRVYYKFDLQTHKIHEIALMSSIFNIAGLRWLTDGKFVYLKTVGVGVAQEFYLAITSGLNDDEKTIYIGKLIGNVIPAIYCRYPYVYMWGNASASSSGSYVFHINKINVVTGETQDIYPDSIKIGDVTFYTRASDENGSPQAPYYRLYNSPAIFWDYNEYFDDGVLKDDLQGGYGEVSVNAGGGATHCYAVYMDNLELRPSEHNMTVFISDF